MLCTNTYFKASRFRRNCQVLFPPIFRKNLRSCLTRKYLLQVEKNWYLSSINLDKNLKLWPSLEIGTRKTMFRSLQCTKGKENRLKMHKNNLILERIHQTFSPICFTNFFHKVYSVWVVEKKTSYWSNSVCQLKKKP